MIFMLLLYGFPNYISFDLIKFDPKEFCESILIQKTMMQKKKKLNIAAIKFQECKISFSNFLVLQDLYQ